SRRRHTRFSRDWSSDVCSSDLLMLNEPNVHALLGHLAGQHAPGLSGLSDYLAAVHHQNLAVAAGVERLREMGAWRLGTVVNLQRSEERRVGKERRCWACAPPCG